MQAPASRNRLWLRVVWIATGVVIAAALVKGLVFPAVHHREARAMFDARIKDGEVSFVPREGVFKAAGELAVEVPGVARPQCTVTAGKEYLTEIRREKGRVIYVVKGLPGGGAFSLTVEGGDPKQCKFFDTGKPVKVVASE